MLTWAALVIFIFIHLFLSILLLLFSISDTFILLIFKCLFSDYGGLKLFQMRLQMGGKKLHRAIDWSSQRKGAFTQKPRAHTEQKQMWPFSVGYPLALKIPLGTYIVAGHKAESGQFWTILLLSGSLPEKEEFKLTIYTWIGNITAIRTFLLMGIKSSKLTLGNPIPAASPSPPASLISAFQGPRMPCILAQYKPGHILVLAGNQQWIKRTWPMTSRNQVKRSARYWITFRGYFTLDSLQLI